MNILAINAGSSSIKYMQYDAGAGRPIIRGVVKKIGEKGSYLEYAKDGRTTRVPTPIADYQAGFDLLAATLEDLPGVAAVGHRVVHGGPRYVRSSLLDEEVIKEIEAWVPLAPLHNPANLMGIREAARLFPGVPHVAVFDTAFHEALPPVAHIYPLPLEFHRTHGIRVFGFHGLSCRYVSRRAAELLGRRPEDLKMIICHLGNGITVAAVREGTGVDTSMGLTPLGGAMMGTRSGDLDPGLFKYLHTRLGLGIEEIDELLNRRSGLLGISGVSKDMKVIIERAAAGDERCRLAMEMFSYRVKKYIGAYAAVLGGLDVVVFTGGIGENAPAVRSMICEGLEFLGIELDGELNGRMVNAEGSIDLPGSAVRVMVVPTNEEIVIVEDTVKVAGIKTGV